MEIAKICKAKHIWIVWFWKEWEATLDFLIKIWCTNIDILDKKQVYATHPSVNAIISWDQYLANLDVYDLVVKSVGISPYLNPELQSFSWTVLTATEIFFSNYSGKIIWITGTKGKSTTSSLCHHVLSGLWYDTALIGNIWTPSLSVLWEEHDYIVYELSSYMLERFHPNLEIWVLINIFHDHLDWYNWDFDLYMKAKFNVLKNAKKKIINHELSLQYEELSEPGFIHYNERDKDINFHEGSYYIWDHAIFTHEGIHLEWEHNMENITCVLSILHTLWIDIHDTKKILTNFCALPHRLQDIGTHHWIRFINDAISTTPESTIEAIKTYKNNIWTIFLWGSDRGYVFEKLITSLEKYEIENIVLFPDSWEKIKKLLSEKDYNILETKSMKEAVTFAFTYTEKGKICLLSTASPSFSLWEKFEAQWNDFRKSVEDYASSIQVVKAQ